MSDYSDVFDRWVKPRPGVHCLLNTDDADLLAWAQQSNAESTLQHCQFRYESHYAGMQLNLPALTFPDVPSTLFSDVFWAWPKARAEAEMTLDWLSHCLAADGQLWLIGSNRSGVRSAPKLLQALGWTVQKVGSARHCVLLRATPPTPNTPFSLEQYWVHTPLPDGTGSVWSLPGVFAHGRLDKGSLHLLPWLVDLPSPLLDFGCGAGLLSLAAARSNPDLVITGVDNHWLAVLSMERTIKENDLKASVCWSDGLATITDHYASLITNPPFHAGLATHYDTTHDLLRDTVRVLQPEGRFLAVVNDHLPYANWLQTYLKEPTCLAHIDGFRVWSARI